MACEAEIGRKIGELIVKCPIEVLDFVLERNDRV
jgi:hypothetical protein